MPDLIYLVRNRREFTKASLTTLIRNTEWRLVSHLMIYEDTVGEDDGTRKLLLNEMMDLFPVSTTFLGSMGLGGPIEVMNHYLRHNPKSDMFAKIDNDVIVPPQWLNKCIRVMSDCQELDLLGIEPPLSRTPHYPGGVRSLQPELNPTNQYLPYALCDSIGGIGLMRTRMMRKYGPFKQYATYGGFTDWQLAHLDVIKGWINPPIPVFLLDRLPIEPWKSISDGYTAKGWQREWSDYPLDNPFWSWWDYDIA